MLNELDREHERRGLHFVRYADDCVITAGSSAAADRVMHTVTRFIEKKLGLKVNATRSKVTRPTKLTYLGFWKDNDSNQWKARPHRDSIKRFERRLKKLTERRWSVDMDLRIKRLNYVIRWINYFRTGRMKTVLIRIDAHI